MRMFTHEAAKKSASESLDHVYIDASHDYCGVTADMNDYGPKLLSGGIMADHGMLS